MQHEFSFSETKSIAPADFRRWAMGGTLLGAVSYTLIAIVALWQSAEPGSFPFNTQLVAAIAFWGAVMVVVRGHARAGVTIAICAFWLEVHAAFALSPVFPSPGLIAAPVIVTAAGLLLGSRAALALALLSVAATGPIYTFTPAHRGTPFSREEMYWLVIHAVVTLAAWGLVYVTLSALGRILQIMREKERELADMIAFAPDGIVVLGRDDVVLAANPAAERVLGLPRERSVGRAITEVLADAGGIASREASLQLAETMQAPVAWTFSREGTAPVHVEVTWRQVGGGRRQLMLRDVSERVRSDELRRDMEMQLAHAQRLEAVGQLAGGIAHDFNNLLMTISGSAELLRVEHDLDERGILLDEISAAQERGAALTRRLLEFARREVVHPAVIDLSAQVVHLQRLLQRIAGDLVPIYCDLDDSCTVRIDVGQLEQALVNLVANARDAMPQGGVCAIVVDRTTSDTGGPGVRLRVSDRGVGMDDAVAARAFEPFFTTKPRGRGTGLGLASVHGIVMQSGGSVSIESAPGRGTTIALIFPFVNEPVATVAAVPWREELAPASGRTILVADDDDSTRAVVGRILQRAGYRVLLVPDGVQALRRLEADMSGIDMLVTDVVMPGLSGPELAMRVRESDPSLPILFMSGYPEDAMGAVDHLDLEQDFVAKPFSGADLTRRVAEHLAASDARRTTKASGD